MTFYRIVIPYMAEAVEICSERQIGKFIKISDHILRLNFIKRQIMTLYCILIHYLPVANSDKQ